MQSCRSFDDDSGLSPQPHGEGYYDPSIGRFTQQDPLVWAVDPMQWNRYTYVGDSPVNYIDPNGTNFWDCAAGVMGGFGAGIGGWLNGPGGNVSAIGGGLWLVRGGSGLLLASEGMEGLGAADAGLTGWGLVAIGGLALTYGVYEVVTHCF